jgi:hypothetical protein
MSDAFSDMIKPSFWEEVFSNKTLKDKFKNDKELNKLIIEFKSCQSDKKELKEKIMERMLYHYGENDYYSYMFKESWRFPIDNFILNI